MASELHDRFLSLHRPGRPLIMPNAWDAGSAMCLSALGFEAVGTSSGAIAAARGVADGAIASRLAWDSVAAIAAVTPLPVSADLENGLADSLTSLRGVVRRSVAADLAGVSLEDWPRDRTAPAYSVDAASRRVTAAVDEADGRLVVTARADGLLRAPGTTIDQIIERLLSYEAAGADVLFAPGLAREDDLRAVLDAVSRPLSVMWLPTAPSIRRLSELGAARISLGPFAMYAAYAALTRLRDGLDGDAARFWSDAAAGSETLRRARGAI